MKNGLKVFLVKEPELSEDITYIRFAMRVNASHNAHKNSSISEYTSNLLLSNELKERERLQAQCKTLIDQVVSSESK